MTSIYDLLAPALGILTSLALLLVLIFVSLGAWKKYWVVCLYVSWELFATAALTVADMIYHGTAPVTATTQTAAQAFYSRAYWTNDLVVDLLRFVLVIVLIYKAAEGEKRVLGRLLTMLVVTMIVLPFVIFHPTFTPYPRGSWFNSASQLMNFGAALMNLILWAQLIRPPRRRERDLLMVSLGLGIVVTGTSLMYGFRHLFPKSTSVAVANLLLNLVQLIGWSVWCWAFWPSRAPRRVAAVAAVPVNIGIQEQLRKTESQ